MKKIDTHQHLFYPDEFDYGWTSDFPDLQGAFTMEAYREAVAGCDIESALFMEVDVDPGQHAREARFFSRMAEDPANKMAGVIAKCLPEAPDFIAQIEAIRHPALKGIRRVLHTQDDELSRSDTFRKNVRALSGQDLSFDLCVTQKQLTVALELIRACPKVRFILNHCGMPGIGEHTSTDSSSWQQWQAGIRAIAREPNAACKLSGITAYATAKQRNVDSLRPYLLELLEGFGAERIVWGSDWPVCNLADGLRRWSELTDALLADLSEAEQENILCGNARTLYKLQEI